MNDLKMKKEKKNFNHFKNEYNRKTYVFYFDSRS
jgi:hypothetical protein